MKALEMKPVSGLLDHEANSQSRYECLSEQLKEVREACEAKETDMGMDNISDKVNLNINPGGSEGGLSGLAALMMASRGDDSQSNIWASILPALMNQRDGGFGGNGIWPLLLLALLRGNGGGLFGGTDGGGGCAVGTNVLDNLSDIRAAIPTAALENQNAILSAIGAQTLGNQQGFAGIKDSVQNTLFALSQAVAGINQNVSAQGCQTRETVKDDGEKTRALITTNQIADLQRQLGVAQAAAQEERHHARVKEVEVNVTQQVNQQQQQAQFQAQQQELLRQFALLTGQVNVIGNQVARSTNDIVTVGGLTNATQSANPVNVR